LRGPRLDHTQISSGTFASDAACASHDSVSFFRRGYWPVAFDPGGHQALYLFNGDVFLLDLAAARFRRLTSTPAEEKSIGFSPDGRCVSFVRDNDLYVFDLAAGHELRVTRDGSETTLNGTLSWVYWEEVFGRRDIGYWWSPGSQATAYLQSDESVVDVSYFTDFTPFVPRVIRQRYARAGRPNPRVRVGIAELGRDTPTWVQFVDKPFEYIVRVKWLPEGFRPDRKYPVILSVYGGPAAPQVANAWQQRVLFDQLLLAEGYVVAQVDNRSATAISKPLENTVLKRLGEAEAADQLAAVRWLKRQPWVDGNRVGVTGSS
jgi:dipeptidyl aminopeptidase/acylaminoacyl peptidase